MIFAILVFCGIAYHLLAIVGVLKFRSLRGRPLPDFHPPVSILKPVKGRDPRFYDAIRSHATQDYPEFEILFGIADPSDPAHEDIARLKAEFPALRIDVLNTRTDAANAKVGALEILTRAARFEHLLVNDGDIVVPPGYLRRVIAPLADPNTGLVTCLYNGRGVSIAAKAEALGIATEFQPSVLVARLLSNAGFALGSTMAFRRSGLESIGGFEAIRDYLADDYQLGARIGNVALADVVVETGLGTGSWSDVWKHQVRWSRTIRVSRPAGYFGYVVTQLTFWSLIAGVAGQYHAALAGIAVRVITTAFYTSPMNLPAVPFRDLFGMAVWAAGMSGNTVEWRGTRFRLTREGKLVR